ncbi:MAG TPA: hypothetical protein VJ741_09670 [Solirubrobacteraceae bacterium]|nr:hypothetical protein [Solirubrobacteraceae bacterium]
MAVPFDRVWSATADANGNATVTLTPFTAYASTFIVAGQTKGNPIWAISKNGNFLLPGAGPQVALGSVYFKAMEQLTITVTGAQPGASILGTIWGQMSTTVDGSDLVTSLQQTQLSGSFPTFSNQIVLGTLSGPANTSQEEIFTVPVGTQSIGYLVRSDHGNDTPGSITITGQTSDNEYFATVAQSNIGGPQWAPFAATDSAVLVQMDTNSANPSAIDVLASPFVQTVDVTTDFETALTVTIHDPQVVGRAASVINEGSRGNALAVTTELMQPLIWEPGGATSVEVANALVNGGTVTPIAGVAGESIYVFLIALGFDASSAGNDLQILEGGAGGTSRGRISAASVNPPAQWWGGRQFGAGNGLTLKANGAALTPRGVIVYKQG